MKKNKHYKTDSSAESILSFVIDVLLFFGGIIAIALIVLGILIIVDSPLDIEYLDYGNPIIGVLLIVAGIINLFMSMLYWSMFRIWINVSRNLFNINAQVESINNSLSGSPRL